MAVSGQQQRDRSDYSRFRITFTTKLCPRKFTHENGDFGSIYVTERSYAAPTSKVESHISDRFCAILWCGVNTSDAEVNW